MNIGNITDRIKKANSSICLCLEQNIASRIQAVGIIIRAWRNYDSEAFQNGLSQLMTGVRDFNDKC
jgi:hypothetical protein